MFDFIRKKPTQDEPEKNADNIKQMEYEFRVGQMETIIASVKTQGGNVMESEHLGKFIDLMCETPLFVCAEAADNKPENKGPQVAVVQHGGYEIIPVFTRRKYAVDYIRNATIIKLEPKEFMLTLNGLGGHISINPNCEDRMIILKDVFQKIIFEQFVKKHNAKVSIDEYKKKNDVLGILVCEYNREPEQSKRMLKIMEILSYLEKNSGWVPCRANYSEEDYEKLLGLKKGDKFSFKDTRFKPDILKHTSGKLFFPLFSQKEEAPEDYAGSFSWMNMPIVQCCQMANNNPDCSGIIINAFTNSLPIPNDLIDIILNNYFAKENLINEAQMLRAEKEANGGMQLDLDDERLYFIRVFVKNGTVEEYSIDKEAANDSHYTLRPYDAFKLSQLLESEYGKGNFADNLRQYFAEKTDYHLVKLMQENNIKFQQFHFHD